MRFPCAVLLMVFAVSIAHAASGSLTVFDDADQNGFNRLFCTFGDGAQAEQDTVHSGTTAIGVTIADFNSTCWQAPSSLSRQSDYDAISLWVNVGSFTAPQDLRFLIYGNGEIIGKVDLVTVYGGPLPAATWIPLHISLADLPADAPPADPEHFDDIVIRTYSTGLGGADRFFVDDVVLIGADIFKDGFEG
ncbi:hypothetical protein FHW12_002926 [Dokdonella fugitiva]|uniref:Carbohydrate binding protein with CBM11 domain n=1 Tax=Dokdonella fugitiva TaxID=328517 RepID=A0A839F167_9GAMM|nr:hypothetical protein [Dokdonella fugitiva]MBA8888693.1 hypothetical protein [Dokdonella fugitiva]